MDTRVQDGAEALQEGCPTAEVSMGRGSGAGGAPWITAAGSWQLGDPPRVEDGDVKVRCGDRTEGHVQAG